jgi:hypothetical protein
MGILNLSGFENGILQMSSPVLHTLKKLFSEYGDGDLGNLSPNIVLFRDWGRSMTTREFKYPHRKKSQGLNSGSALAS